MSRLQFNRALVLFDEPFGFVFPGSYIKQKRSGQAKLIIVIGKTDVSRQYVYICNVYVTNCWEESGVR